ncbi:MAG: DUF697 domain-containing protein [Bacteroidia bacterium]|nr:DUF697 domain-containing protein [Bacteroidia bacterium]
MSGTDVTTLTSETTTTSSLRQEAREIVRKYCLWSAGAGMIPIPIVDVATLTALQIKMISDLAKHYNVPFSENRLKAIITSLISTIAPSAMSNGMAISALKAIPLIGGILGFFSFPAFASAFTFALGEIFIAHLEKGGDVLTFDAEKWKEEFKKNFQRKKEDPDYAAASDDDSSLEAQLQEALREIERLKKSNNT